jgi:hypothetical protein
MRDPIHTGPFVWISCSACGLEPHSYKELCRKVLARDNWTCQACGLWLKKTICRFTTSNCAVSRDQMRNDAEAVEALNPASDVAKYFTLTPNENRNIATPLSGMRIEVNKGNLG